MAWGVAWLRRHRRIGEYAFASHSCGALRLMIDHVIDIDESDVMRRVVLKVGGMVRVEYICVIE